MTKITKTERDALVAKIMTENTGKAAMAVAQLIADALGVSRARGYFLMKEVKVEGFETKRTEKVAKVAKEPSAPKAAKPVKVAKTADEIEAIKAKNLEAIKQAAQRLGADRLPLKSADDQIEDMEQIYGAIVGDEDPKDFVPKFMHKELGIGDFTGASDE